MSPRSKSTFHQFLQSLQKENAIINPIYFHHLSDLNPKEATAFEETWSCLSLQRRRELLEALKKLLMEDYTLSFNAVCRIAIKDEDPQVRLLAVHTLMEYPDNDLLYTYLDMVKNDQSDVVRASVASALGHFVYLGELDELPADTFTTVIDSLLNITSGNDEPMVRRRAMEALGYCERREVHDLIQSAYQSEDDEWLTSAVLAMGRSANPIWEEQVLQMLDHPIDSVRREAARSAGELELEAARPQLLEMLQDDDNTIRMISAWSLSQICGEGVREALEELLETCEDDKDNFSFIENALDNLAFNENLLDIPLMEFDDEDDIFDTD
ncbi:MAG: HEAT repeat domain-containing protein [Chloroflexota bacterium]